VVAMEGLWLSVSPRMVGNGKLPGTTGEGVPRELVLSGSLFCVTGSDSDGDAVSAMSDRVR
jgi:hypothetical protein